MNSPFNASLNNRLHDAAGDLGEWTDAGGLAQYVGKPVVQVDMIGGTAEWFKANPGKGIAIGVVGLLVLRKLIK